VQREKELANGTVTDEHPDGAVETDGQE